ncbi:MAG TPA: hypothetical protein VL853_06590 [Gemmatimonadales bacterium]|nr:hypothetical protein [Gemmatimonadales bacterium]
MLSRPIGVVEGLRLRNHPDFKSFWELSPFEEFRRPKESSEGN